MEFDWDSANAGHVARHRISPEECEQVFSNGPLVMEQQLRKGETRLLCLGETDEGRLLTLVVAQRDGKIRVVTAHPMHRKQREIYGEER